jgi:hypothetical protein
MTTEFGYVNLKEQYFAPLVLAPKQRNDIIQSITETMVALGAKPAEILSIYSDATVIWSLPTLYSDSLGAVQLTASYPSSSTRPDSKLYRCYKSVAGIVQRAGMCEEAFERLECTFGPRIRHPLYFTRTLNRPEAPAIFGQEWACLLAAGSWQSAFQENHAFIRPSATFLTPPMGVLRGSCEGSASVSAEFLEGQRTADRGFIEFQTFDAIDRAHLWVMQNYSFLQEPDKMLRGLCLLKLEQKPLAAYQFEQTLRRLSPFTVEAPTAKSLIYTPDHLDEIREIWYDTQSLEKDKFSSLHRKIVPLYLDDLHFKKLFGLLPNSEGRFTYKSERKVDAGLEKFIALFLQTQRAIGNGEQVRMT